MNPKDFEIIKLTATLLQLGLTYDETIDKLKDIYQLGVIQGELQGFKYCRETDLKILSND
jgi:hypothetical protein